MKYHILYNPLAANGNCENKLEPLKALYKNEETIFVNMTEIGDFKAMLEEIPEDDSVILCGGDGTLNHFINHADGADIKCNILYFPAGSGNDFLHDIEDEDGTRPFSLAKYITDLPYVTVNGKTSRFINGIGYGIDGYCCEEGDKIREKNPGKAVNYPLIAIKGLLFHYHRTNATVTVDGQSYEYKNVWLAPTMNGRFYGGGMNMAPSQDRLNEEKTLSLVVLHNSGKLGTLMVFPKIFDGKHASREDIVAVHKGHDITVKFDKPTALQIDGETVLGVTEYRAFSVKAAK